jgi:Protein of unknown function (DUF2946)
MRNRYLRRRHLVTSFLLGMLLFRAYVPVGYMPASGTPFLLELCPAAGSLSMPMPAHHHHSDTHSHFENCPFGSATAAGPAPAFSAVIRVPQIELKSTAAPEPAPANDRRVLLPQPRGPPVPA